MTNLRFTEVADAPGLVVGIKTLEAMAKGWLLLISYSSLVVVASAHRPFGTNHAIYSGPRDTLDEALRRVHAWVEQQPEPGEGER